MTHEIGHALGLGHNPDPASVMHESLGRGVARRAMTARDLNVGNEASLPSALRAADEPATGEGAANDQPPTPVVAALPASAGHHNGGPAVVAVGPLHDPLGRRPAEPFAWTVAVGDAEALGRLLAAPDTRLPHARFVEQAFLGPQPIDVAGAKAAPADLLDRLFARPGQRTGPNQDFAEPVDASYGWEPIRSDVPDGLVMPQAFSSEGGWGEFAGLALYADAGPTAWLTLNSADDNPLELTAALLAGAFVPELAFEPPAAERANRRFDHRA